MDQSIEPFEVADADNHSRKRKQGASYVWQYFDVYTSKVKHHLAYCHLCKADVNYTISKSTGMLTCHMRVKHREIYEQHLLMETKKQKTGEEDNELKQTNISRYVHHAPTFEKCCIDWIIAMYQPLSMIEKSTLRKMYCSLNSKAPIIGKDKARQLLSVECAKARSKV
jgi:hypothetical protein